MAEEKLAVGDLVQIAAVEAASLRGLSGGIGEIVRIGAPASLSTSELVGTVERSDAVLVALEEPHPGEIWIASNLLAVIGIADWRLVSQAAATSRSFVRVRPTPETMDLGLAGLVGQVMGDTKPSSSGVTQIIGNAGGDYAINAWFDERREQYWFDPSLLDFLEPISSN